MGLTGVFAVWRVCRGTEVLVALHVGHKFPFAEQGVWFENHEIREGKWEGMHFCLREAGGWS